MQKQLAEETPQLRVVSTAYTSTAQAQEAALAALRSLTGPDGAATRIRFEHPGRDNKQPPTAVVMTVSRVTYERVFAAEQRQALASLSRAGTRVCRHLSATEHACRRALYAKYNAAHPAPAGAQAPGAQERPKLPPHRFNSGYTTVTFNYKQPGEEKFSLSDAEVEALKPKSGKAPTAPAPASPSTANPR